MPADAGATATVSTLTVWRTKIRSAVAAHSFGILLLSLTLCTRLLWAGVIPMWQTPDEIAHFSYIQSLGEHLSLTSSEYVAQEVGEAQTLTGLGSVPFHPQTTQRFSPRSQDGPAEDAVKNLPRELRTTPSINRRNPATYYPPGYYLLGSVVYRITAAWDVFTIMFSLRVLSAVLSTATVFFSYLTLKRLFDDLRAAQASALVIALLPMYAFMGMAVNPDVLIWLIFSIFLYLVVKAFDEGLSTRMNLGIAATLVVGLWVKQTFLIALPIYGILLGFLILKGGASWRDAGQSFFLVILAICIFDVWLYFGGSVRTSADYPGGDTQARSISGFIHHFDTYWLQYARTFDSFWGTFGWLDTRMSHRIYDLLRVGTGIAGLGLVFHLVSTTVRRNYDLKAIFLVAITASTGGALILLNYMRITSGEVWLLQGRYFFVIIVPMIALLMRGSLWYAPGPRARDALLLVVVMAMIVFHAEALFRYVIPRYYL